MIIPKNKKKYFEGWYFKLQLENQMIAFIPGIHIDSFGRKSAFIQIIMNDNSYYIPYDMEFCKIDCKRMLIKIGNSIFYRKGVILDIESKDISIKGRVRFGALHPINYTIMGIFKYFPFMECRHEIISMRHSLNGKLLINNKPFSLDGGVGYLEKDKGHSFPKSYIWLQCNRFTNDKAAIVFSLANIPYLKMNFQGSFCVIHYKGIEYRFATYLGVTIYRGSWNEIYLKQGGYTLRIRFELMDDFKSSNGMDLSNVKDKTDKTSFAHTLLAPVDGEMLKNIHEHHYCNARFTLYKKHKLIFDLSSKEASLEIVE
jgi:hypothetical protein